MPPKTPNMRYKVLREQWDTDGHAGFRDERMRVAFPMLRRNNNKIWEFLQFDVHARIDQIDCVAHLRCLRERLTHACKILHAFVREVAHTTGTRWHGALLVFPFRRYHPTMETEPSECTRGITEAGLLQVVKECKRRIIYLQEVLEAWRMQVPENTCCWYHTKCFAKDQERILKCFTNVLLAPFKKCDYSTN